MAQYFAYLKDDVFILQSIEDKGREENFSEVFTYLPEGFRPKYNNPQTMAFDLNLIHPNELGGVLDGLIKFTAGKAAEIQTFRNVDLKTQLTDWKRNWNSLGLQFQLLAFEKAQEERQTLFVLDAMFSAYGGVSRGAEAGLNTQQSDSSQFRSINNEDDKKDDTAGPSCTIV